MTISDLIAGVGLAAFLALPFGMIASLFILMTETPRKFEPNAPLISPLDIQRSLIASGVFLVIFTLPFALMISRDRADAESWQTYIRDHKCVVVDSRTRMESHFNPATKTNQSTTVTEYLWRCESGDEHWRR